MAPEMILVETHGKTGLIRLNRPQALNALCDQLMIELGTALRAFDKDPAIAAIVITGSEKAFAAGADIKEMKDRSFPGVYFNDFIGANWETVLEIQKPVIAALAALRQREEIEVVVIVAELQSLRGGGGFAGFEGGRARQYGITPTDDGLHVITIRHGITLRQGAGRFAEGQAGRATGNRHRGLRFRVTGKRRG